MSKLSANFVKIGDLEFSRPEPVDDERPVERCEIVLRRGNLQATLSSVGGLGSVLFALAEAANGVTYDVGSLDLYGLSVNCKGDGAGHITISVEMRNSSERWTVSAKTIVGKAKATMHIVKIRTINFFSMLLSPNFLEYDF